jgi:hypothetical protein
MKRFWLKLWALLNPEEALWRERYIKSIICECKLWKQAIGEEEFNKRFGADYITRMESDLLWKG